MKLAIRKTYILYLIYFAFIWRIFFGNYDYEYFMISIVLLTIVFLDLLMKKRLKFRNLLSLEFMILCIYISTMSYVGYNLSSFVFVIYIYIFHMYFSNYSRDIEMKYMLKFINITFMIYLLLSVLLYLNIIKPFQVGVEDLNIFYMPIRGYVIKTLIGIEGSTASIDSYGSFIFIINILFNKYKTQKYFYSLIGIVASLFTFRMTPIVSLVIVIIYIIIQSDKKNIEKVSYSVLFILCVFSWYIPSINILPISDAKYINFTHARSIIWAKYIDVIKNTDIKNVILGYRNNLPFVNIAWSGGRTFNPHSSYLTILLFNGVLIFILFFIKILCKTIYSDYKIKGVVLFIMITGITNTAILYFNNPIFMIILYYFMYCKKTD